MKRAVVLALLAHSGCGYSLAGRGAFLPAHIKTIGVPTFVNQTDRVDLEKKLTEEVVQELNSRGKYVVRPEATGVDAVLDGKVTAFVVTPVTFEAGAAGQTASQASRYAVQVRVRIEFKDLIQNKTLWADANFGVREEYEVGDNPDDFFDQENLSIDRLSREFAKTLVSRILEAF
jgi:hypothetical protein